MGVHGLWKLIEPSGKTVPVETLENKILAVDVSIWLHQAVKGFQDAKGQPLPNAHLLGLYHRICKLLYFRVKPVFVFDGGVPVLKKQTIAKRNQQTTKQFNATGRLHKQLLSTLLKHSAVSKVLSEKAKASIAEKEDESEDLFALPPPQADSSSEDSDDFDGAKNWDIHSIDMESESFRNLPADVRHEILTEIKETRKQSSWGRLHELPTQSDDFAVFQLNRLRKRYQVQVSLEEAEKEMGGHSLSLAQLEQLLNDQGVITRNLEVGHRIASDETTRFLLIKDVKRAMEEARQETEEEEGEASTSTKTKADVEFENDLKMAIELSQKQNAINSDSSDNEEDLQKAIKLSLECQSSKETTREILNFSNSSSDSEDTSSNLLTSAKNYMMEYSGLTPAEIAKIIGKQGKAKKMLKTTEIETIKEAEIKTSEKNKIPEEKTMDDVEIMSDSGSDSSEISDQLTTKEKSTFEIVIKPTDVLEDDLFGDVFEDETITKSSHSEEKAKVSAVGDKNPTSDNCVGYKNSVENVTTTINSNFETDASEKIIESPSLTSENEKDDENPTSDNYIGYENSTETADENPNFEKQTNRTQSLSQKSPLKSRNEVIIEKQQTVNAIREMLKSVKENEDTPVSVDDLKDVQKNLAQESKQLRNERATKERLASNITDQMYQEAQELLQLFGVPYVVAPMEAEAQCAFLDAIGLTNGTITDDSDIWLFGGKTVYKNFFNQTKHVMEFNAENIQHSFKLTREQMILLALLVGSDYTTGLQGVGPVTALEILAAFPTKTERLLSGLFDFKLWYLGEKTKTPSHNALRKKLKNLVLTENFPSSQVAQAYLDPQVETSKETFSWSKPDVVGLIDFAKEKFGWSRTKSEEILKPVLKRLEERFSQTTLLDYFETKRKIDANEKCLSKRVKVALEKIGKNDGEGEKGAVANTSKRKVEQDEEIKVLKQTKARSRRRLEQIEEDAKEKLEREKARKTRISSSGLHAKEVIVQKELEKKNLLRSKLKAIEVFRKSKQGPGYVKKREKKVLQPKADAELSESDSSD